MKARSNPGEFGPRVMVPQVLEELLTRPDFLTAVQHMLSKGTFSHAWSCRSQSGASEVGWVLGGFF